MEPHNAVIEVEEFLFATTQLAQTTLRSVVGQADLDELLAERDKLNAAIQTVVDEATDPWGIKVSTVEIKDVDLPVEMKRAMARQAEAERERRAKVIHADGEFEASKRLSEAAYVIEQHPIALQLRYLATLSEIAAENNSTTIFPLPIEMLRPLLEGSKGIPGISGPTGGHPAPPPSERAARGAGKKPPEAGGEPEGGGADPGQGG
jgi:regulator of protease activity HflC (stomatin/prohibitin superfamily)